MVRGRRYAVEHHVHLYDAHQAAGLAIDAVREPVAGDGRPGVPVIRGRKPRQK